MNVVITVELTLSADDDVEAVKDVNDLMAIYRNLRWIGEWEIVEVEELAT